MSRFCLCDADRFCTILKSFNCFFFVLFKESSSTELECFEYIIYFWFNGIFLVFHLSFFFLVSVLCEKQKMNIFVKYVIC